jgi:hypothetical protein
VAKVEVCYAHLGLEESRSITATQLRGYLGYLFIEDTEFHHHMDNPYHYPLIQYKKVDTGPLIMGLGQYADILFKKISGIENIVMGDDGVSRSITSLQLKRNVAHIKKTEQGQKYRFSSPWLAFNKENYQRFLSADDTRKENLLKRTLTGNILSMLKGLDIFIDYRLEITAIQHTAPFVAHAHGNTFWALKPEFSANITLPRYIGLGKSVSKGFGIVEFIGS